MQFPEWKEFQVEPAAKLLGFFIGPAMGKFNWCGPLSKFSNRVKDIKSASASISVNAYDFNSRVAPVLGYQAQLLPLPGGFAFTERIALTTVLRAPNNTFRHGDFFQLNEFRGPKMRSPLLASASALFRTASRTIATWPQWVVQMQKAAHEHLPLETRRQGKLYPKCWDSYSYVQNLRWAYEGFPESSRRADPDQNQLLLQKLSVAGLAIREKYAAANAGAVPPPGSEFFIKNLLCKKRHMKER